MYSAELKTDSTWLRKSEATTECGRKCRNGPFLNALSSRSVWKIFPSVIWYFSWVSRLKKWKPWFFLRSRPQAKTSEWSEAPFFQSRNPRKISNYTRKNFPNTEKGEWVKESAFSNILVFSCSIVIFPCWSLNTEKSLTFSVSSKPLK